MAAPAAQRRVTISDVAREAQVSRATVSRVMNGLGTVNAEVSQRVRETAERLEYSPSGVARGLSLGRTNVIGLVVPDLSNPTFQGVLLGLTKAAAEDGYRVLVADTMENPDDELALAVEVRSRCDALVLCSPRMDDTELATIAANASPMVLINRLLPGGSTPAVRVDHSAGMTTLIEHLYEGGHRRIVYLGGPGLSRAHQERQRAVRNALSRYPDLLITEEFAGSSFADGYRAAFHLVDPRATAVIAYNDLVALALLGGLRERGIRVPEDVSVVGFGNIPFARFSNPPLTTVSASDEALGKHSWDRMRAMLRGEEPEEDITLVPRLTVRESSRPAGSA